MRDKILWSLNQQHLIKHEAFFLSLPLCVALVRSFRGFTKAGKQDIKVVQNVILEVDKQHVFNNVTMATAHSREEQSHTH